MRSEALKPPAQGDVAVGTEPHYDWVVIGSGFGGSVAALRLSEKGYSVLILEKGRRLRAQDFPKTNWNVKRWLWLPTLRFFGLFKITLFRHVTTLSGVGVGGGSLVYANTLPMPPRAFFTAQSWAHLADWERELGPHYASARRMLGATVNPRLGAGDEALRELAAEIGRADAFAPTTVGVFFGEADRAVGRSPSEAGAVGGGVSGAHDAPLGAAALSPDPYFGGRGPERRPCIACGGCMTGCRFDAKNTLDKNYLYLAEQEGAVIQAESEVFDVSPLAAPRAVETKEKAPDGAATPRASGRGRLSRGLRASSSLDGSTGYRVSWRSSTRPFSRRKGSVTCRGVVFAGGVLGTVRLLLTLKGGSLSRLSERVGRSVRTNSESLIGVTVAKRSARFSEGVAIASMLQADDRTNLQPVRYGEGSGAWRLLMSPLATGRTLAERLARAAAEILRHPIENLKVYFVDDWAKRTQILLFMQTTESTLRFVRGRIKGMRSAPDEGTPPAAFIPRAHDLARRYARIVGGKPTVLLTETVLGTPTTAHILGGATMGRDAQEGVIDAYNRVFGYANMYVCDGSTISANPGVNPSLTIVALAERAMSQIAPNGETEKGAPRLRTTARRRRL